MPHTCTPFQSSATRLARTALAVLTALPLWCWAQAVPAAAHGPVALAQNTTQHVPQHLRIAGTVTLALVQSVRQWLQDAQQTQPGATIHVQLDSLGGDGIAGMQIGLLLRQAGAHTRVDGTCASACAYMFLGGVQRQAQGGQVGLHAAQVMQHRRWLGLIPYQRAPDPASDPQARRLQAVGDAAFVDYAQALCLDEALVALIKDTPPHQMHWLTQTELEAFNVITHPAGTVCSR